MKTHASRSGFSLLEVLFATAAVSLVLVAVLSTIISSLQNSRTSLEQTKATQYANETLEWFRKERDNLGWTIFSENMPGLSSRLTYCFSTLPASVTQFGSFEGECDSDEQIVGTMYSRSVTVERTNLSQVDIEVSVSRPASSGIVTTSTNMTLTEWQ